MRDLSVYIPFSPPCTSVPIPAVTTSCGLSLPAVICESIPLTLAWIRETPANHPCPQSLHHESSDQAPAVRNKHPYATGVSTLQDATLCRIISTTHPPRMFSPRDCLSPKKPHPCCNIRKSLATTPDIQPVRPSQCHQLSSSKEN